MSVESLYISLKMEIEELEKQIKAAGYEVRSPGVQKLCYQLHSYSRASNLNKFCPHSRIFLSAVHNVAVE